MKSAIKEIYYKIFDSLLGDNRTKLLPLSKIEKQLLSLQKQGYLYDEGWIRSYLEKNVIDLNGNPKPWLTFTATQFLEERLNNKLDLFEFGGGNSTLFWAKKCNSVNTVEHDLEWFNKIKGNKIANVEMYYQELEYDSEYCRFPNKLDKEFDIIIVDGRDRVNCCKNSINSLRSSGVIVLDDSIRPRYIEASNYLIAHGFRKLNFWGMEALYTHKTCTTIFYKEDNCLGI
jgi:hypothetical protein